MFFLVFIKSCLLVLFPLIIPSVQENKDNKLYKRQRLKTVFVWHFKNPLSMYMYHTVRHFHQFAPLELWNLRLASGDITRPRHRSISRLGGWELGWRKEGGIERGAMGLLLRQVCFSHKPTHPLSFHGRVSGEKWQGQTPDPAWQRAAAAAVTSSHTTNADVSCSCIVKVFYQKQCLCATSSLCKGFNPVLLLLLIIPLWMEEHTHNSSWIWSRRCDWLHPACVVKQAAPGIGQTSLGHHVLAPLSAITAQMLYISY